MAVSAAIRDGRLVKSVVRNQYGDPKIADPVLADQEWAANTNHASVSDAAREIQATVRAAAGLPPAPAPAPAPVHEAEEPLGSTDPGDIEQIGSSSAKAKFFEAALKELKFKQAAGELVPSVEVRREWAELLSSVRTKLLEIPNRVKQQIPDLEVAEISIITDLVREALADLVEAENG